MYVHVACCRNKRGVYIDTPVSSLVLSDLCLFMKAVKANQTEGKTMRCVHREICQLAFRKEMLRDSSFGSWLQHTHSAADAATTVSNISNGSTELKLLVAKRTGM